MKRSGARGKPLLEGEPLQANLEKRGHVRDCSLSVSGGNTNIQTIALSKPELLKWLQVGQMGRNYMVLGFDLLLGNLMLLKPDIGTELWKSRAPH